MRQQMEQLKASHQAETPESSRRSPGSPPPSLLALGLRAAGAMGREFPQRTINTVTTNVPGPQYPLYAAGRQMVDYLPFVPLAQGVRIGVAILSYNGQVQLRRHRRLRHGPRPGPLLPVSMDRQKRSGRGRCRSRR